MRLGIYGHSKSGKTTLIEKLMPTLLRKGYRVAVIKHIRQKGFTIDAPGKDTWRYGKAGAKVVAGISNKETFMVLRGKIGLDGIFKLLDSMGFDIILIEGFKEYPIPKVAVGRISEGKGTVLKYKGNEDELGRIVNFIDAEVKVERIFQRLPGLNCGRCGYDCDAMARKILGKEKKPKDCVNYSKVCLSLRVNGKDILLGRFAKDFFTGTVLGAISSLKGVKEPKKVEILIMSRE